MQRSRFICRSCLAAFGGERRISTRKTLKNTFSPRNSSVSTGPPTSRSYHVASQPSKNQISLFSDRDFNVSPKLSYTLPPTHTRSPWQRAESRVPFSTISPRQRAILNPRKDEDGKDMGIEVTSRASKRLKEIMISESNPDLVLRVQVESGGCHGFQYLMSLTNMSKVDRAEDTVFESDDKDIDSDGEGEGEGSSIGNGNGNGNGHAARVVMDEPSLELLKGSKVDYTMELIGSQFKIADNPLATSSCGCGTSFDIKA